MGGAVPGLPDLPVVPVEEGLLEGRPLTEGPVIGPVATMVSATRTAYWLL
jgi:hypothetical protein